MRASLGKYSLAEIRTLARSLESALVGAASERRSSGAETVRVSPLACPFSRTLIRSAMVLRSVECCWSSSP